ncbi:head GIN domain-containing protein [Flavobacterium sp. H122]|uniref:head GIN domain-containing protein n=1 Tax=Flavobacterium sp. H122 TaxID=2529860 RepID=UPI0010AB1628|nr:head GIN domain-containing protein [Flavobacterium sp. H122]
MKKHFLAFSLVSFFLIHGNAQTTKSLGSFTKVTGFDKIEIHLVPSNENKIELSGTNSDQVDLVNNNGELKVRMPVGKLLKGDDVVASVYYKKLEGLEANEGSLIISSDNIKASIFEIIAKEGGNIKVGVEASKISVKTSSGAVISLSGNAQNIDAVATAGGILDASKCKTQQATVTVNAGGQIDISAYDVVEAKARAGGKITVYGKPKQVNQKIVLGGNIQIIKDSD